jgi:hypothetical protein
LVPSFPFSDWRTVFKKFQIPFSVNISNSKKLLENCTHIDFPHLDFGYSIELDLFLPKECLVFEYQGEQHLQRYLLLGVNGKESKDQRKRDACQATGITLIEIPYWWDKTSTSLATTIRQQRKDIILNQTIED